MRIRVFVWMPLNTKLDRNLDIGEQWVIIEKHTLFSSKNISQNRSYNHCHDEFYAKIQQKIAMHYKINLFLNIRRYF